MQFILFNATVYLSIGPCWRVIQSELTQRVTKCIENKRAVVMLHPAHNGWHFFSMLFWRCEYFIWWDWICDATISIGLQIEWQIIYFTEKDWCQLFSIGIWRKSIEFQLNSIFDKMHSGFRNTKKYCINMTKVKIQFWFYHWNIETFEWIEIYTFMIQ